MTPLQRIEELKRKAHNSDDIEIKTELMILRARVEGEQVYLEALNDRVLWNRYPTSIQDQCIEVLGRKLGEAYQHTETQVYACASADRVIEHRIATFQHLQSGALLNLIPGGTFQMGGEEAYDEKPIHTVTIKAMLMGRYQVSQSVWDQIGGSDSRKWRGAKLPIDSVSWVDAKAWLRKMRDALRLPSEAEWEYACRAGSTTAFCFGETVTPEQVNHGISNPFADVIEGLYREKTVEVGSLPCNAFGLHEVHGNLSEWCEDRYVQDSGPGSRGSRNSRSAPLRLLRGGGWYSSAIHCHSASRYRGRPDFRFYNQGFRISKSLD